MKKIKVAIDTTYLDKDDQTRGIGVHTNELLKRLKKISGLVIETKPRMNKKYDIYHYPKFHPHFLSFPLRNKTKKIVTIHDLIPLIYPKYYPPGIKGQIRYLIQKLLINKINMIITISETSKKDICRFLNVKPEKVVVVDLAAREIFRKIDNRKLLSDVKKKYNLPSEFVLYVGDVNYNKNLQTLIKACSLLKIPLVICGKQALDLEQMGVSLTTLRGPKDWIRFLFDIPHPELSHFRELLSEFEKNKNILRLGYVPDNDLVAIYNLASVYCQPSLYEGFGLPVLEALSCGVPVVASKIQAHVEIADKAVCYAKPGSYIDFAKKIKSVLNDKEYREKLIEEGFKRCKDFNWQKCAKQTLDIYRRVTSNEKR